MDLKKICSGFLSINTFPPKSQCDLLDLSVLNGYNATINKVTRDDEGVCRRQETVAATADQILQVRMAAADKRVTGGGGGKDGLVAIRNREQSNCIAQAVAGWQQRWQRRRQQLQSLSENGATAKPRAAAGQQRPWQWRH